MPERPLIMSCSWEKHPVIGRQFSDTYSSREFRILVLCGYPVLAYFPVFSCPFNRAAFRNV